SKTLTGNAPIRKVARRHRDATDVKALEIQRNEPLSDDELRASAADVDDEPPLVLGSEAVRDAGVDETSLLDAADDLDRVSQRLLRVFEELLRVPSDPQCI